MITLELSVFQKKKLKNSEVKVSRQILYRIQANNSVMCMVFCTGFIDLFLKRESFLDSTISFLLENEKRIIKEY